MLTPCFSAGKSCSAGEPGVETDGNYGSVFTERMEEDARVSSPTLLDGRHEFNCASGMPFR